MTKYYQYAQHQGREDPIQGMKWMLKAMMDQSNATAYTQEKMIEQGIYFMIYQGRYQFYDTPWPKDIVICATIDKADRFFLHRRVKMMGVQGELLAEGEFPWFIYHREKEEMIPWQSEWIEAYGELESQHNKFPPARRYRGNWKKENGFTVGAEYLDANDHVNNLHYIRWMLTNLPEPWQETKALEQFSISYTKELMEGDEILILTAWDNEQSHHEIRLKDDTVCARGQGKWRK